MRLSRGTSAVGAWVAVGVVAALALVGCGGDDDEPAGDGTPAEAAELSSYDTVAAMGAALDDAGITCVLEYEGLEDAGREVSLCTIDGQQALLTVWSEPDEVAAFVESDAASDRVAVGENWTVDVDDPATAEQIAEALGGRVATE